MNRYNTITRYGLDEENQTDNQKNTTSREQPIRTREKI